MDIVTSSYNANVHLIDEGIIYSEKCHEYKKDIYFDTYASDWFLGFADLPENRVAIRSGTELIPLSGPTIVFQPPFSLIETHIEAGSLRWSCVCSSMRPLVEINTARVLTGCAFERPKNRNDIIRMLEMMKVAPEVKLQRNSSSIAEKLKHYIDKNFCDDLKISAIAIKLNYSRVVMTRAFKRTYGISPVEYRHKLRVHQALIKMRHGSSITDALYDVGFSDPSQFILHFKHLLGALPKQYNIAKKIKPLGLDSQSI